MSTPGWLAWAPVFAQTDVPTNGSLGSGLSAGATGTCGYNRATAPGTERIANRPGFLLPAWERMQMFRGQTS